MPQDTSHPAAAVTSPSQVPGSTSPAGDTRRIGSAAALGGALLAFAATRIYFCFFFAAAATDINVYFDYAAQGADFGRTPYLRPAPIPDDELPSTAEMARRRYYGNAIERLEYPPTAYWLIWLPRALSPYRLPRDAEGFDLSDLVVEDETIEDPVSAKKDWKYDTLKATHAEAYGRDFRRLMLAFDVAGFALFCAILLRRRPELLIWGMWAFTLSTAFLFYVLFERFDVVMTFTVLAWAYCQLRAGEPGAKASLWSAAAYTFLGLGISLKLIPVLLVPFALLCDFYALLRPPRRWSLLIGPVLMTIAAVGPFAYYYAIAGDDLMRMFRFHSERGVQIESSYATLLMLTKPAHELQCYFAYGSWNLRGPWADQILAASTWVVLAALAGLGLRSFIAPAIGERYDRAACYRMACAVIPVATLLAKVFSVQYLLWAVPMLLLGLAERTTKLRFVVGSILTVAACAFTAYLYPYHYLDSMNPADGRSTLIILQGFEPSGLLVGDLSSGLPRSVMILRNVLFGGLCAALYYASMTRVRSQPTSGR